MKKTLIFIILCALCFGQIQAQISQGGTPISFNNDHLKPIVPSELMPSINEVKLLEGDEARSKDAPYRFGVELNVHLNPENAGVWDTLMTKDRIWRLQINSPDAKSLHLQFNDFYLPKGAELFVYSEDKSQVLGAFTSLNNKADRVFATSLIFSEAIIIEYFEPADQYGLGQLNISEVIHGYRDLRSKMLIGFEDSGPCNINTICPEGNGWEDETKSVARIIAGGGACTGYLVNNSAQDCRPLFLTANHCLGGVDAISSPSANNWVFYWRYESPSCNPTQNGPLNMTTNGATLLANPGMSGTIFQADFAVLELTEDPGLAGYDVYYAGFDANEAVPGGATSIHHPRADVKKIAIDDDVLRSTQYGSGANNPNGTHWRIGAWDEGTTEPGSSGSPIFDNNSQRALGFLSGGAAACDGNVDNDEPDWYGKLSHAWENDGATDTRRRINIHLDPIGNGTIMQINGSANPCGDGCINDETAPLIVCPSDVTISCEESTDPSNTGSATATDNCTVSLIDIISSSSSTGSCDDESTLVRTWRAVDQNANESTCIQSINMIDNTAPSCTNCPSDVTVSCDAVPIIPNLLVNDNCDPSPSIATSEVSTQTANGSCSDFEYTINRTFTITDRCGNSQQYMQEVTVVDETAPVLTCPADVTVACNEVEELDATGMATAIDNCDPNSSISYSDEITGGDCDWECTIERTWVAIDACGNTTECVQTITSTALPLIEEALSADVDGDGVADPIVLGFTNHSLVIGLEDAACIIEWMPTSGDTPNSFERGTLEIEDDCAPGREEVDEMGKVINPLFGEALIMAINVRLNEDLGNTPISEIDCEFDYFLNQWIRPSSNPTVNDLLHLANLALSGVTGPYLLEPILDALECINATYNMCDPDDNPPMSLVMPRNQDQDGEMSQDPETSLRVFPNPTNNWVFIDLADYLGQEGSICIYSSVGQVIFEQRLETVEHAILPVDLVHFANGVYLLTIQIEGKQPISKHLIKTQK